MIEAFKKTLKIGIIDSYFDADGLFLGDNIKIICERKQIYGIKDSNHASRILNIIVSELKNISDINVEIYIFPILNDENKGINRDLYHAFNECIRNRVNIINLSLGTVRIHKDYVFDRLVEEAFNNDIYVVSAYSNTNAITYPACKKNVIGVKSLVGGYSYIYNNDDFIYANNDICFKYNYISVKNKYDIPLIGNSFLCAKVTGIISNQLIEKKFRFNSVSGELKKMASTNLNIDSLNRKIVLLYEIEENIKLIEIDSDKFIGILQLKKNKLNIKNTRLQYSVLDYKLYTDYCFLEDCNILIPNLYKYFSKEDISQVFGELYDIAIKKRFNLISRFDLYDYINEDIKKVFCTNGLDILRI